MLTAALPPAEPPARVVAGVRVTWPLSKRETVLAPGSKMTVRIASKRRRAQVSFVRVNAGGRVLRSVARRTLRRGSFTVKVPASAPGTRYALRLLIAGRKRFSWVTTAPVPAPPTREPRIPPSFCGPEGEPRSSEFRAEIRLAAGSVKAGETLHFSVHNVGVRPIIPLDEVTLASEADYPLGISGATDYGVLRPGESEARTFVVPASTVPGRYRLFSPALIFMCDMGTYTMPKSPLFWVLPG